MRQHKHQIKVGDILYEASAVRKEVIEYKVVEIYIKDYKTPRTVVVLVSMYGVIERDVSVVTCWHDTHEEASECLEEMLYSG